MRVENLIGNDFQEACRILAEKASEKMLPDMIIGIRTGGVWVMEAMKAYLDEIAQGGDTSMQNDHSATQSHPGISSVGRKKIHYCAIGLHREGTGAKGKYANLLHRLPQWLCNGLRISEALALRMCHAICPPKLVSAEKLVFDEAGEALLQSGRQRIWVVDDAVDSGRTLASIAEKLKTYPQAHQVLYAALTVTEKQPLLMPDCYLYHGVLLRFPWSNDCHPEKK